MAFAEQVSFQEYPDSSAPTFTITRFYFLETEHIYVFLYPEDGSPVQQKIQGEGEDWTIEGVTITRLTTWDPGTVIVRRINPYEQVSTYRNAEIRFDREQLEYNLDYITMLTQQNNDLYRRSIHAPIFEQVNLELPEIPFRVGEFMTFDANGDLVVRQLNSGDITAASIRWVEDFTEYDAGWIVEYEGSIWVGVDPKTGIPPTIEDPSRWQLYSNRFNVLVSGDYAYNFQYPEFTIFVDTSGTPNPSITLTAPALDDRRVTIAVFGGGEASFSGPGLSTTVASGTSREAVGRNGSWFLMTGYGSETPEWDKTIEDPPFGDELKSGELFFDGTNTLLSSDGREAIDPFAKVIPAIETIDGTSYPSPECFWIGKRGVVGSFGSYENLIRNATYIDGTSVDSSEEGDWLKVTSTADDSGTANAVTVEHTALAADGYLSVLVRRGNTDISGFTGTSSTGSVSINWGSKSFSFSSGAVDFGSIFISDEIALVKCKVLETRARTYLYPKSSSGSDAGDFTYYKNLLTEDGPTYPVPYVSYTSPTSRILYNFDWDISDEWTLEGWFRKETEDTRGGAFYIRDDPFTSGLLFNLDNNGLFSIAVETDGGGLVTTTGSAYNAGTYYHCKIVWESGSRVRLFVDGVLDIDVTTNVPTTTEINKVMWVGSQNDGNNPLTGYMADLRIVSVVDTSTTHYDSNLPYYDPKKTYGKNAMWSVTDDGDLTARLHPRGLLRDLTEALIEQLTEDLINAIYPIGCVYWQFPGKTDPNTLLPGTWTDISSEFAGCFFRVDDDETLANAFNGPRQPDAMQRITGVLEGQTSGFNGFGPPGSQTGVFSNVTETHNRRSLGESVGDWAKTIQFDSANSTAPSPAKTNDVETRPVNYTVRIWERTS